ncbi:MAG: dephospho-CoA kinase [Acidobacteriaceae bacterium]|nr:dephospho-CoA kinase [Acidobacteriaceae bacterium]
MIRVGLTGGYATGKTFVAAELGRLGCYVIYADRLGHQVLEPGGEAYQPAVHLFGSGIVDPNGVIDRKQLAELVFDAPELLEQLTAIVHPAVFRLERELTDQYARENPSGMVVYEAAILIETGRYSTYDRLIVTAADQETQIARGMHRDGVTREQALARIHRQLPLDEKRKYANYVIDTSGTKEDTARQVREVYEDLKRLAEKGTHA